MTQELQYFARVSEDGSLQGLPKRKFQSEVKRTFSGMSVEILVRKKKKFRSVNQNRYYWLIVMMLSEYTGFTKAEMHSVLKRRFLLTEKVNEGTGVIYEYIKSTTELSTVEYEEYLESVRRFAAEDFDMVIPLPNEQLTFSND